MKDRLIFISLFILFLIEGMFIQVLTKDTYSSSFSIFPRLVLVLLIYLAIYYKKNYALFIGIFFGILYDLIFGRVFGIYTISFISVVYFVVWVVRFYHPSFLVYLIIQSITIIFFEVFIYGVLRIFQLAQMPFGEMFIYILLPTLTFNLLFAIVFYPLFIKFIGRENV
ncbi:MAG: rod shape-determining protein MreD [Vulcanibacillus sp.]